MIIGVPAESVTGERRVALIPESIQRLIAAGIDVCVEKGAGHLAWFSDEDYAASAPRSNLRRNPFTRELLSS